MDHYRVVVSVHCDNEFLLQVDSIVHHTVRMKRRIMLACHSFASISLHCSFKHRSVMS